MHKETQIRRVSVFAILFGIFAISLLSFAPPAEAIYPSPPPTFVLKLYADDDDGHFEFGEILPTQNDGVFVYDKKNDKALVFSNVVFSEDTKEVRFTLTGDELDGERHYWLGITETESESFARVMAGEHKVRIMLTTLAQIQ